ncbi:hypothetical protein L2E82_48977 [Cichorium intybus]|uniref:Uncharacterized protein n=1 Tax=Cichorium intybus TaxID=13427 RepID=A0ACB8YZ68_CICIN|nr:hypothetical protein L2E82_48977 [Cichorium intybus]
MKRAGEMTERELLPPNLLDVVDREGLRFQYPTTNELPSLQEPKSGYSAISNPCSRRGFRTLSSVLALSLLNSELEMDNAVWTPTEAGTQAQGMDLVRERVDEDLVEPEPGPLRDP